MTAPRLSVVIPTRDRPRRLRETVAAVLEQRDPGGVRIELEILVVDDGSATDPAPMLATLGGPIRLERQPPAGPASARNRGVAVAKAPRVLFLGDDTRPAEGAIAAHLRAAAAHGGEVGVQGLISWDPRQPITDVMRFLAPAGPQFYFRGLGNGRPIPFTAVLGSNFSAPTRWLRAEPFDLGFPDAAIEDTEMAWRWRKRGWVSVFAEDAVCWHHHHYEDLEPFLERQHRAGRSARHAVRRHPRLLWHLVAQPALFAWVVRARRLLGRSREFDDWDLLCRRALWRGFWSPRGP